MNHKTVLFTLTIFYVLLMLTWHIAEPVGINSPWFNGVIAGLPLLSGFIALRLHSKNSYVTYSLILLLYFCHAVVALSDDQGLWIWPVLSLIVVISGFVLCLLLARQLPMAREP